jgi:hypothetical protein
MQVARFFSDCDRQLATFNIGISSNRADEYRPDDDQRQCVPGEIAHERPLPRSFHGGYRSRMIVKPPGAAHCRNGARLTES